MEALKLKIFNVLTEKIQVSEFETWLYNSERFLNEIDSNSFFFDILSINYKSDKWALELNNLIIEFLGGDCLEVLKIKNSCLSILESETLKETYEILIYLTRDFDYDTQYSILWKFYTLRDYFGLVDEGIYKIGTLQIEAKFYAKQTIEIITKIEDFNELKTALEVDLIPFKRSKDSLKQKIFSFLRK